MTTTSVKDVGSAVNSVVTPNAASRSVEESFQSVWNSQAGAGKADADNSDAFERTVKQKGDAKPGDDLRAKDNSRKDLDREKTDKLSGNRKAEELSEEDLEKAAEIVGAATAELIEQIADTFGISVEEVQAIMADMDLEPMDLLQGENLSNLLLQVGGAENSLALLTNEQLYADYQMLMEQGRAMAEDCCTEMKLAPEELQQAMLQLQEDADSVNNPEADADAEEPVLEITLEDESMNAGAAKEAVAGPQATEDSVTENGSQQGRDAGAGRQNPSDSAAHGNLVLQTIQNENAQPQTAEVQAPVSNAWSTGTQDIMRQIMDYLRLQVKPDVSSMEMQLHPASLGTLQIHVASEGGALTAHFVTENETVKAALESQMVQLKENFEQQGVKVEAIEVTVQTHQFEQNLEQGRGRQPQSETSAAGRTRTRRINLGGLEGMEMPEELESEDRITAEVMAANGQTVDYTA